MGSHPRRFGAFVSKAKARVDASMLREVQRQDASCVLQPWRLHDLRRTLATGLQRLGVRFEVTEAVLNHISGTRGGVAGVYQRHDWTEEKRAALNAWASHVAALVNVPRVCPQGAWDGGSVTHPTDVS